MNQFYRLKRNCAIAILFFFALGTFLHAQNPIVTENALTGTPSSQWDVNGAGDLSIQGFATDISVNKGQTVHFKINTNANAYTINIYRLGYYQGNGARLIGTGIITATLPQSQPSPVSDPVSGLVDCGNWSESAHWDVPPTAVSGVYIAKLTRTDNGGASHIVFIVRDDARNSDLYFQTSDATWQAYNVYGGNSLYTGSTSYPSGHATKVSYNRPFVTRNGGGGGGVEEDWLFNAEYPMIRWLERNGYDVTYATNVDADRYGSLILNHKTFLSVGHDEYWSAQQYANVKAARDAGVHLAFFSGNEIYWKTRWETSTDGSNTAYRTLVCYKEGTLGENSCGGKCDPLVNEWTGLWRDGCAFPLADGCNPENALSGQISWDGTQTAIEVPASYKNLRFWRNTGIASLTGSQTATLSGGTLGYEWDWDQYTSSYPRGRMKLSATDVNSHVHNLSLYRTTSGALVFGAGTVQWSWGLDGTHDRGGSTEDADMQQATVNLFADMGVQPGTLQSGLLAATASSDFQAPSSNITSPAAGIVLTNGVTMVVSGTASDNHTVAGVDISVDGGTTWLAASGTTSWTFTWTPTTQGAVTIMSRAFDDSGNMESSSNSSNTITDTVSASTPAVCPCTVFTPSNSPTVPLANDNNLGIELGMKFRANANGYITGVRYYKGAGAGGMHLGHLWSKNSMLAEVTFTNETASGWQQASFIPPVQIFADTTYIVSYFSSSGDYCYTDSYFNTAVINGPLTGLANGTDGTNGVYKYSNEPAYPTSSYQASNYWVDAVFETSVGPDTTAPAVISKSPAANATNVNATTNVSVTFNEPIDVATLTSGSFYLLDASNTTVAGGITYNALTRTAVLDPATNLSYLSTYTVVVKGGSGYQRIKDQAGNAMTQDVTWQFTTEPVPAPAPAPPTDGPGGPILVIGSANNPFSRYTAEILRAEGFNEFSARDILQISQATLDSYEVVILGEIALNSSQVTLLTNWVNNGGVLIAFKPDAQLSSLMGITATGSMLTDKYLLADTNTFAGKGIVAQTIQYHGTAALYTLSGASKIATLYSDATTATSYPAVTSKNVGSNGGRVIAFLYDLPRSIVYSRQGNPAWAGQKRDGQIDPIRSDDLFYPDWIDMNKVMIPQADEQQHLLSNLILKSNLHHKPLPRLWFLPKGLKAAVIMTGDNHGDTGMQPRFDINIQESTTGCSVDDWECIRSTGYLYVGSTFTDAMASYYSNLGFEVALHLNTGCQNATPSELDNYITSQFSTFMSAFPSISAPRTNRTHCIQWADWSGQPEVEAAKGIRLDLNYYYWPSVWVNNQAGMFTGSGMPMRFAKADGTIIDCYQATTQMPDESGETFPQFCDALLDKAIGPEGYYGVFTANMHFDNTNHPGANAIVSSAKLRGIPVVSAQQMLTWLDGRNNSSFSSITWNSDTLKFQLTAANGARNMRAMIPAYSDSAQLQAVVINGVATTFTLQTIKGIAYAFVPAVTGNYTAIYNGTNLSTTSVPCATDNDSTEFADGTFDAHTIVANAGNGEIILKPSNINEFSGTTIPAGWQSGVWSSGGTVTVGSGQLTADGASASTTNSFGQGSSLEFVATFQSATFQNLGFTTDAAFNSPWVTIGQGNSAGSLYARTDDGASILLGSNLVGTPHYYRIDWNATSFAFYVDSILVTTINKTVSANMVAMISDFNTGGGNLLVDWLRVTPYDSAGTYVSGVFDYGSATNWGLISWTSNVPAGTQMNLFVRTGNVAVPDNSWTNFSAVSNNSSVSQNSRYIQYKAELSTTVAALTPALYDLSIACTATTTTCVTPTATISAVNSILCSGSSTQLKLDSITGTPPFKLTVNGTQYNNIVQGQTFATISPGENSVWGNTGSPSNPNGNDGQPIEVGMKFRASVNGFVSGVRFYKGISNTGTHVASLWNKYGSQLSTATFTSETGSGWQEVHFTSPVFVFADTTYIVSYYSAGGTFAITPNAFASAGVTNGALTALQAGVDGVNGVYAYGGGFPSSGSNANYWVDVLFLQQQTVSSTQTYTLTNIIDANNCAATGNLSTTTVTVTPLPAGTISLTNPVCKGQTVSLTYSSSSGTGPFTLNVNGNTFNGVNSGVPFNTGMTATVAPVSIWSGTITPGTPSQNIDSASIELGVKFRANIAGKITGIRFYKGSANLGIHTGSLWTSGGVMLATATFVSETGSGWQQVLFSSPVTISPNTTYIASYHAPNGKYAFDAAYFSTSGVTNGPLKALQNGEDGPNALYAYGSGVLFPNQSFNAANYWVDVVFEALTPPTFALSSVTDANGCHAQMQGPGVIVNPLDSVKASVTAHTNILCKGMYTGSATASAIGGTGNYLYSWNDSLAQTTSIASSLKGGNYTVTITDVNGCNVSSTATVAITEPAQALASSTTHTNVLCYGNSSGTAIVLASGGTAPYSFAWSNSSSNDTINGLSAGVYTVSVTDNNGCLKKDSVVIGQPAQALNSSITFTNVACNGGATGIAIASPSGGTTPYSFMWSNSSTSNTITALSAGVYTVNITDNNGCLKKDSVTITQPAVLALQTAHTDATCYGASTGSATITANGGTSPYSYAWNTGSTLASITNVTAGTYSVVVTDFNGCSQTATVSVAQPSSPLSYSVSTADATCNGATTGASTITPTGGTAPYTISWSNGGSGTTVTSLGAGTYSVIITDANTCTVSANATIIEPAVMAINITSQNLQCFGDSTGTASANVSGGTTSYSYTWSPGGMNTASITHLAAGDYTVDVTDQNGCTANQTVSITEPTPLTLQLSANAASCENNNGAASVVVTGGTGSDTFVWSDQQAQTTSTALNLAPATYSVQVTDANGCTKTDTITVGNIPSPTITVSATNYTICTGSSTTLTAAGGLNYTWTPGSDLNATTGSQVIATPAATITYWVIGENGTVCKDSTQVTVNVNPLPATPTITASGVVLSSSAATGNQWYLNGTVLTGATAQTYSAVQNGSYMVSVTDTNGCTALSAPYNLNSVGITSVSEGIVITVFPNPVDDGFTLSYEGPDQSTTVVVQLYSMESKLIYEQRHENIHNGFVTKIERGEFAAGVYYLDLRIGEFSRKVRLIFQ